MSEEPKIRRGSRVVVAKLYGDGMPSCCVDDDDLFDLMSDREIGTVVRVTVAWDLVDADVKCVGEDVLVAVVVLDSVVDDQYDADGDGMPQVSAWLIPVACLQEVPDERVTALEAEAAELRAQFDKLWDEVNSFIDDESCPACGDGPEPVRRWLHHGDRIACVCGHEGQVSACSESMPYLEWDEVSGG